MYRSIASAMVVPAFFLALPAAFAQTEMSAIRQQRFAQRDTNHDGFLGQDEYGGHPGNFRALDRDGDGRLSREEFVRRSEGPVVALPDEFGDLDLNGDNTLSRSEWYGQTVAFDRVDRDGDGRISRDEQRDPLPADDREARFSALDTSGDDVLYRREWRDEAVAFPRADRNDDGVVSLREFLNLPPAGQAGEARFDLLDLNSSGVIERSEWRDLSPTFAQADRNSNGMVTRWEFVNPPPAEIRTPLFEEMDYNNDGLLSRREWPVDARAFDRADRNHDGIVTLREFASSANEDPNQGFRAQDTNRDGFLSRTEWTGTHDSFSRQDHNHDGRVSRSEYTS